MYKVTSEHVPENNIVINLTSQKRSTIVTLAVNGGWNFVGSGDPFNKPQVRRNCVILERSFIVGSLSRRS